MKQKIVPHTVSSALGLGRYASDHSQLPQPLNGRSLGHRAAQRSRSSSQRSLSIIQPRPGKKSVRKAALGSKTRLG